MAFETTYPTRIDEVFDFVNKEISDKIKNKVIWHAENVPFSDLQKSEQIAQFEKDVRRAFGINSNIPKLTTGFDIRQSETMDPVDLFNKIKRIAYYWSSIRSVTVNREYEKETPKNETRYAKLNETYSSTKFVDSLEKEFVALKGQPINAEQLKRLLLKFYEKWEQLPPVNLSTNLCHSNCHGSCHYRPWYRRW